MSALVQQARTYLGAPYRHRGRKRTGIDCAGLPWCCYADLGVELPDLRLYGREPHQDGMMSAVRAALGEPVWQGVKGACARDVLRPGDVVVLVFVQEPHHMAIVGDDAMYGLSLIHADGTLGTSRVVEHGMEAQHLAMICAVFRRPVSTRVVLPIVPYEPGQFSGAPAPTYAYAPIIGQCVDPLTGEVR